MKRRIILLALASVMLIGITASAYDGIGISFVPDKRAPSLSLDVAGTWSLEDFSFSVQAEITAWWYIGNPPTGYRNAFYSLSAAPYLAVHLSSEWSMAIALGIEYRTNLPDRIVWSPRIMLWHEW